MPWLHAVQERRPMGLHCWQGQAGSSGSGNSSRVRQCSSLGWRLDVSPSSVRRASLKACV